MPKIINGVRENAIKCAGELIASGEYDSLPMRKIAERCDIAVGTLYNYFKSKEDLLLAVINEDFEDALAVIDRDCLEAQNISDGVCAICRGLRKFAEGPVGSKTATVMSGLGSLLGTDFEKKLRASVSERIEKVLLDHGYNHNRATTPAVTEVIISLSARCELNIDSILLLLRTITEKLARLNRIENANQLADF